MLLPKGPQYISQAILYSTGTAGSQFSHKPRVAMWQHSAHEEWDKLQKRPHLTLPRSAGPVPASISKISANLTMPSQLII